MVGQPTSCWQLSFATVFCYQVLRVLVENIQHNLLKVVDRSNLVSTSLIINSNLPGTRYFLIHHSWR